jgi:hypothetical protein
MPVIEGAQNPLPSPQQGEVIYEGQSPPCAASGCGMDACGMDGWVSPRRAMEDYWNSPESDQGYPRCPGWFPLLERIWFRGDYLLWWTQGPALPPLVTTSTNPADAGILGRPTTSVLFGDTTVANESQSGARLTLGCWLDPCRTAGIEATYLGLGQGTAAYHSPSTLAVVARPYYDVSTLAESSLLIASPGTWTGNVTVDMATEMKGLEILFRRNLAMGGCDRLDLLFGYRWNSLSDDLLIQQLRSDALTTSTGFDQFKARNRFNGFELGVAAETRYYRWSLDAQVKVALGNTNMYVLVDGQTTTNGVVANRGPLLALPSNMGEYQMNEFTAVPELGITVGYDLTCRLRMTVGYTLIYWGKVARAGDQIDLEINPAQLTGGPGDQPRFSMVTTDYWAQGLNVGLEWRY